MTEEYTPRTGNAEEVLAALFEDASVVRVLPEGEETPINAAMRVVFGILDRDPMQCVTLLADNRLSLTQMGVAVARKVSESGVMSTIVIGDHAPGERVIRLYDPAAMGGGVMGTDVLVVDPDSCADPDTIKRVHIARQIVLVGEDAHLPEGYAENRGGQFDHWATYTPAVPAPSVTPRRRPSDSLVLEEVNRLLFIYDHDATFGVREFAAAITKFFETDPATMTEIPRTPGQAS